MEIIRIRMGLKDYDGTIFQWIQFMEEFDNAPETKDLPPEKKAQIKKEICHQAFQDGWDLYKYL